jgi:hypothetical protein
VPIPPSADGIINLSSIMDRKVYLIGTASTVPGTRTSIALLLQDVDAMTD